MNEYSANGQSSPDWALIRLCSISRQDNCELRRYNRLAISNLNFANALQAEPICCECLPFPEIVQWLCPIGNEACVTPRAAILAIYSFIFAVIPYFDTSRPG